MRLLASWSLASRIATCSGETSCAAEEERDSNRDADRVWRQGTLTMSGDVSEDGVRVRSSPWVPG